MLKTRSVLPPPSIAAISPWVVRSRDPIQPQCQSPKCCLMIQRGLLVEVKSSRVYNQFYHHNDYSANDGKAGEGTIFPDACPNPTRAVLHRIAPSSSSMSSRRQGPKFGAGEVGLARNWPGARVYLCLKPQPTKFSSCMQRVSGDNWVAKPSQGPGR